MTEPQLHHLPCPDPTGSHRLAYWQWGKWGQWGQAQNAHLVLCVHGLTRQGRDFDTLARALLERASALGQSLCVVCPDVAGRGASDWLSDPALYQPLTYVADMQALLAHLHGQQRMDRLDWVGTSMGGIIGMLAAAHSQALPRPIDHLVLNDVGPHLDWTGLARIKGYVGQGAPFASLQEGLDALRLNMAGFGPHSDQQWQELNTPMLKRSADGRWALPGWRPGKPKAPVRSGRDCLALFDGVGTNRLAMQRALSAKPGTPLGCILAVRMGRR